MLNIGQSVYTVCKLYKTKEKFVIYVSKKEIVGINREDDGSIMYTAGKYRELHFKEIGESTYQAVKDKRIKPVYLTKQEADAERKARWENETMKKNSDGGGENVEGQNSEE